jgi:hypothetical protein
MYSKQNYNCKTKRPPWLKCKIKKLIRKRKRIKKSEKTDDPVAWQNNRQIRNDCISCVRKSRKEYDEKLSTNLLLSKHSPKVWWNNVNKLLNKTQTKKAFPPIVCSDTVYKNDKTKLPYLMTTSANRPSYQMQISIPPLLIPMTCHKILCVTFIYRLKKLKMCLHSLM